MEMTSSQYMRIERAAGGLTCSNKHFVAICWLCLSPQGRKAGHRSTRHAWMRDGLSMLQRERVLHAQIMGAAQ